MAYSFAGQYGPETYQDIGGKPLVNEPITILLHNTSTLAVLWTDRTKTTHAANPMATDQFGNLKFFADPGLYDVSGNGQILTVTCPVDTGEVLQGDVLGTFGGTLTLENTANVQAIIAGDSGGGGGGGPLSGDVTGPQNATQLQVTSNSRNIVQKIAESTSLTDPQWGGADVNNDWGTAWNAAAAAINSAGSGRLFVPPSAFNFGNSFANPGKPALIYSFMDVRGAGKGATLLQIVPPGSTPIVMNLLQSAAYGQFQADTQPTVDELTLQGVGSFVPPWAYATVNLAGTTNDSITITLPAEVQQAGYTASQIFANGLTTQNGQPVAGGNPGYVMVADQMIGYTGTSGASSTQITLTSCNTQVSAGTFTGACAVNAAHARVYPWNQQGHILAFQASLIHVGRRCRIIGSKGNIAAGAHGIWLTNCPNQNLSGTSLGSTNGHDIEPSRISSVGGFYVAVGPSNSDGRIANFSTSGTEDGYGGILLCAGDWDISHVHNVIPHGIDSPSVVIANSDVVIDDLTNDTGTAPAYRLDQSGHWSKATTLKNLKITGYKWESPGDAVMVAGTGPSQGVPLIQTVAVGGGAANWVTRGKVAEIQTLQGYSYGLEEGPRTPLLNNGSTVALNSATLNAMNTYGMDPFGDTLTVPGGTGPAYTGINRAGGITSGAQAAGATSVVLKTMDFSNNLANALPTSGIAVAWTSTGPVQIPFTSVTGNTTLNLAAALSTYVPGGLAANVLVTINQFTGCSGGSGSVADLTVATSSTRNSGQIQKPMDLSDLGAFTGGSLIGIANLNPSSVIIKSWYIVEPTGSYTAQDHDEVWTTHQVTAPPKYLNSHFRVNNTSALAAVNVNLGGPTFTVAAGSSYEFACDGTTWSALGASQPINAAVTYVAAQTLL